MKRIEVKEDPPKVTKALREWNGKSPSRLSSLSSCVFRLRFRSVLILYIV